MSGKCPVCGAPMEGSSCGYCGYKAETPQAANNTINPQSQPQPQVVVNNVISNNVGGPAYVKMVSSKSKGTALVLCILLGYLGAHYFYVGRAGKGILYFLTAGLFGIGWIIDIISIATGSFKDNLGLPLK